jgi:hypothetical protein
MKYENLKHAIEINSALDFIVSIRDQFISQIRSKEREFQKGVITDTINNLASDIVDMENKEQNRLKQILETL